MLFHKKKNQNSKLGHTTKVKFDLALKIASDMDIVWLKKVVDKEYTKRFPNDE